jgi:cell division inhibitor SepF
MFFMRSVLKKVRDMLLGTDFDEEDAYDEYIEEEVEEEEPSEYVKRDRSKDVARLDSARFRTKTDSKIVSFKTGAQLSVMITYPKEIGEAPSVCDYVKEGSICVVNLEGVDKPVAQRIADFLGGAAYSINGEIERINNNIFIIAPANVHINGDVSDSATSNILPWIASSFK